MSYKENFVTGIFKPKNPEKYKGNIENITFRSSWELKVMKYLDEHPSIVWWSSEELAISYKSPIDNKMHKYYPDFVFESKARNGRKKVHMWEIKPQYQTMKPKMPKRKTKTYLKEMITYTVNQAKWEAADIFCQKHNWVFSIINEYDLGIK